MYDALLGTLMGLGLAAACGFRVFVPLLVLAIAARAGQVGLADNFAWLASDAAIVAFASASVLELAAYLVPWVDHGLDAVASPAAIVAGTLVVGSQMADLGPVMQWACAIIAGGGLAGAVQATSVGTRAVSTVSTAGIANPIISTVHTASSAAVSVLAIIAPIALVFLAACLFLVGGRWAWRRQRRLAASRRASVVDLGRGPATLAA